MIKFRVLEIITCLFIIAWVVLNYYKYFLTINYEKNSNSIWCWLNIDKDLI